VHRRIDELEKRLGQRLVTRGPAGYKLTELGAEMLAYAARVEEAVLAFERRLASPQMGLKGTIRVTCPEAVAIRLMGSAAIAQFHARYPELRVEFIMSDKLLDLAKGEADIALRGTRPTDEALIGRRVAETPWAIYASRAYCERHGKPADIAALDGHSIALFDVELGEHSSNRWFKSVAPKARIGARCNSISALIAAAKSGAGLAALPLVVGEAESDLVRMLGPVPELTTPFFLVTHRDLREAPRVRAFFDFFVENLPAIRPLLGGDPAKMQGPAVSS
jgi:DNA-binding transcriptional LysR family regulator